MEIHGLRGRAEKPVTTSQRKKCQPGCPGGWEGGREGCTRVGQPCQRWEKARSCSLRPEHQENRPGREGQGSRVGVLQREAQIVG